jgi:ABC-type sulfate transport system permease component
MKSNSRYRPASIIANLLINGVLLALFFLLVLFPSCYVLIFLIKRYPQIYTLVSQPDIASIISQALFFSLKVATTVALIDFGLGLPLAWLLTRHKLPGRHFLANLASLPLTLPTSALGFSTAIFWLAAPIRLSGFWFVTLIHLVFTFPIAVSIFTTALGKDTASLEQAATTLGAPRITVIRTIVFPQIKLEAVTTFIFCFARSLSETGATIVALTLFGTSQPTAPSLIVKLGNQTTSQGVSDNNFLLAAIVSGLLILISFVFFWFLRLMTGNKAMPMLSSIIPLENRVNRPLFRLFKNFVLFGFLFAIVLLPPFFIIGRAPYAQTFDLRSLSQSLVTSTLIALSVTLINLIVGAPIAYLLAHPNPSKIRRLFSFLIDIPLIMPTVALGFSLGLYWQSQGFVKNSLLLIVMAHLAFTYPYVVHTLRDAFTGLGKNLSGAARTLGASSLKSFKTIVLPLLAPAFATASILVFARSLGETGATMAVTKKVLTAPVYLVDLVQNNQIEEAGLASAILIALSFVIFNLFKKLATLLKDNYASNRS